MEYSARLKEKYHKEVVPALTEQFQYKNHMQVPKLVKICLNQGLGTAISDKKIIDVGVAEMTAYCWSESCFNQVKKGYLQLQVA